MADNNDTRTDEHHGPCNCEPKTCFPELVAEIEHLRGVVTALHKLAANLEGEPVDARAARLAEEDAPAPSRPPVAPEAGDYRTWLTDALKEARAERTGGEPEASAYKAGTVSALITALAAYDRQARPPVADNDQVAKFCAERARYITSINNCHPDNAHDYYRWQGHAEARRQLSERLGLPVAWPENEGA